MKVAVVGLSPSTHELAPWGADDWELWGLPWDHHWTHINRFFEMHDRGLLEDPDSGRPKDYWEKLSMIDWGPVYMQQHWRMFPTQFRSRLLM